MSAKTYREIINKFYISLRSIVHPQDITPIIDGLTEFDRQQIAATTKNDGLMVVNDKLFEILGRRTARSFASFVTHGGNVSTKYRRGNKKWTIQRN
jgi:hypothetical protein